MLELEKLNGPWAYNKIFCYSGFYAKGWSNLFT